MKLDRDVVTAYQSQHLKALRLNLKGEYFDQIKSGDKKQEFRLFNDYWKKRLLGREYWRIEIMKGYPKKGDSQRTMTREWKGFEIKWITHPHFGDSPVQVFAIHVN